MPSVAASAKRGVGSKEWEGFKIVTFKYIFPEIKKLWFWAIMIKLKPLNREKCNCKNQPCFFEPSPFVICFSSALSTYLFKVFENHKPKETTDWSNSLTISFVSISPTISTIPVTKRKMNSLSHNIVNPSFFSYDRKVANQFHQLHNRKNYNHWPLLSLMSVKCLIARDQGAFSPRVCKKRVYG